MMKSDIIKEDLLKIFDTLLKAYPLIELKYEYRDDFDCFLVSVDVTKLESYSIENFQELYMTEIRNIQNKYGEEAPLFCTNEEWFTLSPAAISYYNSLKEESHFNFEWSENLKNPFVFNLDMQCADFVDCEQNRLSLAA